MSVQSMPEPLVIVPDGAHSQVLAVAGGALRRRAGLPWRYAQSRFASDGDSVACIESGSLGDIDGLRLTDRFSFRLDRSRNESYGGIALVRGNLFAARSCRHPLWTVLTATPVADLFHGGTSARSMRVANVLGAAAPEFVVDAGDRVLAFVFESPYEHPTEHIAFAVSHEEAAASVRDPNSKGVMRATSTHLPMTIIDERIRSVVVAGEWLVILAGNDVADSIALYDRNTFACVLRIARDAVIPRFVAATCVEDALVVVDDRPGVMVERIDALIAASNSATDAHEGARIAAGKLRATWRESPFGFVRELHAIPASPNAIAVVEKAGAISATLWSPFPRAPESKSVDRWRGAD